MTNKNEIIQSNAFFSFDLTIGNWRWWFGAVILLISTLSMVFLMAKHHVSLGIIMFATLVLSLVVQPRILSPSDYGFVLPNILKTILWTLFASVIFSALVYWFEHSSPEAMEASRQVMESLSFGESYHRDLLLIMTVCVFAPLNEELIFRGVVFRGIWNSLCKQQRLSFGSDTTKKWASFVIATVFSSYFFMSIHGGEGQDVQLYMIFLLGVIACGLYALTGSLIAPIMFHSLNNSFALWQSLNAGHMTLTQGNVPLNFVMYVSPVFALCIALLLWGLIALLAKLIHKRMV